MTGQPRCLPIGEEAAGIIEPDPEEQYKECQRFLYGDGEEPVSGAQVKLFFGAHPICPSTTHNTTAHESLLRGMGAGEHCAPVGGILKLTTKEEQDLIRMQLKVFGDTNGDPQVVSLNFKTTMLDEEFLKEIVPKMQEGRIYEIMDFPANIGVCVERLAHHMDIHATCSPVWLDDVEPENWDTALALAQQFKCIKALKISLKTSCIVMGITNPKLVETQENTGMAKALSRIPAADKAVIKQKFRGLARSIIKAENPIIILEVSTDAHALQEAGYVDNESEAQFFHVQGKTTHAAVRRVACDYTKYTMTEPHT
jgi:hypothetical protein